MPHLTLQGPHGGSAHKYIVTFIIMHDGNKYKQTNKHEHHTFIVLLLQAQAHSSKIHKETDTMMPPSIN
jgi:hypothetical protein